MRCMESLLPMCHSVSVSSISKLGSVQRAYNYERLLFLRGLALILHLEWRRYVTFTVHSLYQSTYWNTRGRAIVAYPLSANSSLAARPSINNCYIGRKATHRTNIFGRAGNIITNPYDKFAITFVS